MADNSWFTAAMCPSRDITQRDTRILSYLVAAYSQYKDEQASIGHKVCPAKKRTCTSRLFRCFSLFTLFECVLIKATSSFFRFYIALWPVLVGRLLSTCSGSGTHIHVSTSERCSRVYVQKLERGDRDTKNFHTWKYRHGLLGEQPCQHSRTRIH